MLTSNACQGPWSLSTRRDIPTLLNGAGEPIWPIGIARLNTKEMEDYEKVSWFEKLFPSQSRNVRLLTDIVTRAGFDCGGNLSYARFNSNIPTMLTLPSVELSANGDYMSQEEHSSRYPGQPYVDGRGRIPIDPDELREEVAGYLSKYPNAPAVCLVEIMWRWRLWKLPISVFLEELRLIISTIREVAPNLMIIWGHALTPSEGKFWTTENKLLAYDTFYDAGGSLISHSWYTSKPYTRKNAIAKDPSVIALRDRPTGIMEFGHLSASEFIYDTQNSVRGAETLEKYGIELLAPRNYGFPIVSTFKERLEMLEETLLSYAMEPSVLFASAYSSTDHAEMAWGYCFNPYTWMEYDLDAIRAIIRRAKTKRMEVTGIEYANAL